MARTLAEVEKLRVRPVQVTTQLPGELAVRMKDYARVRKLSIAVTITRAVELLLAADDGVAE